MKIIRFNETERKMCVICRGEYDETTTEINCYWCKEVTSIPNTLTQLTTLYCGDTNITSIPETLTQLKHLYCSSTKITSIPETLTQLTYLSCGNTKITSIPETLTQLTYLYCGSTKIRYLPDTITKINELPKYNVQLLREFQKQWRLRRLKRLEPN